mmetsp:Transcript_2575/g.3499  ORF Transcript_2575/g.3499 Transcript_2575/m.3499 type:complete len:326 (+) Transcript_2575:105-1082(+)|eukprot:CAMPEP_0201093722 /NCGR_PEP_ID=MMETSP0812-20130820/2162_1 /ASSEMBLY_ACC=CAM_ASM_000668 /TAXON_ID=98059 /ORGANISM="Dinobryon sp., Strain UTEXLB2267" /LENGTH=325 /DNA_ID=CAMNT_0047346001 /DNA_START=104 /DNA_END=1081 /DNA_ORIENTATION=-
MTINIALKLTTIAVWIGILCIEESSSFTFTHSSRLGGIYTQRALTLSAISKEGEEVSAVISALASGNLNDEAAEAVAKKLQQKIEGPSSKSSSVTTVENPQLLEACTVLGSGAVGLTLGLADDIFIGSEDPLLPLLVGSLLSASASFALLTEAKNPKSQYSQQVTPIAELAQASLGRPILSAGQQAVQDAKNQVDSAVESVVSLPSRGQQRLQQAQLEVQQAVLRKRDELLKKIEQAPEEVKAAVLAQVANQQRQLQAKVQSLQEEVLALPQTLQAEASRRVDSAVQGLQKLPQTAQTAASQALQTQLDRLTALVKEPLKLLDRK